MNKIFHILFISCFCGINLSGQRSDTTRIISALEIVPSTFLPLETAIDTTLFQTHFYNPAFKNNTSVTFLGNTGQAFMDNDFNKRCKYQPFIFHSAFSEYFHTPFNTKHYNTRKPFTELMYVSSGTRATSEQILNALHTQNVNQYTNIGVHYDAISSRGIYLNQDSRANLVSVFGSYNKDRYSIYASFNANKLSYEENGGLRTPEDFLDHQVNDPLAYNMNLTDASSMVKKSTVFFTQTFKNVPSSGDTTKSYIKTIPKGTAIHHTFNYSRFFRTYSDKIPSDDTVQFYASNYYLINSASDSAFMHSLENTFFLSLRDTKERFVLQTGIKHQFQGFSYLFPFTAKWMENDMETDTIIGKIFKKSYNNISLNGNMNLKTGKLITRINAEYFLTGYRQDDFSANVLINKYFSGGKAILGLGGTFSLMEPDFFIQNYQSSHFAWNNNFDKSLNANVFVCVGSDDGTIYAEGKASIWNNYIFFNESAIPEMKEDNIYITALSLKKVFRWGGFNHVHNMLLQKSSDDKSVNLPLFAYRNSTFFEQALFKKALIIQMGLDLIYNTSYYSDRYMPSTGMFYRQNLMRTGNYPFMDGFLNWKIKRTRFFLKYTNVLAGFAGNHYFTSYGYPMNERSLKFGLAWTFYD